MFDRVDLLKEFAEHLAVQAAQLVWEDRLRAGGGPYRGAHTKTGPADLVTQADLAAERRIRELLAYHRPDDAVLGEESGGQHGRPGQITWLVDPISGTGNYVTGLPSYGVSVAAVLDDIVLAGAVAEPHSRRLWSAGIGQGARLHDPNITESWLEIRVGSTRHLADAVIATGYSAAETTRVDQAQLIAALLPKVADIRISGSVAVQLCHVAAGWLTAYIQHDVAPWEWTAGLLIAEEAGAIVHRPGQQGPAARLGEPVLATAPRIADELSDALAHSGAADIRQAPAPLRSWPTTLPQQSA